MSQDEKITNAQVGMLIEQNKELTSAVKEVASGVSTLLQFQAAQTQKNESDREWKRSVEKHQDKQDATIAEHKKEFDDWKKEEFQPVRDGQRRNSLITNGVVGIGGTLFGSMVATLFFLLRP